MNLIIYSKEYNDPAKRVEFIFESLVNKEHIEKYSSIEDLNMRLILNKTQDAIIVLIAETREELINIFPSLPLLRKVKVLVLIPDNKPETVRFGFRLEPRFLSYVDSDLFDFRVVLEHMITSGCHFVTDIIDDNSYEVLAI